MYVAGIGIVFAGGRGTGAFEESLRLGWAPPSRMAYPCAPNEPFWAYRVDRSAMVNNAAPRGTRRADKFSKMAVLAACDAVEDSGVAVEGEKGGLGIIISTALGPHATTFRFVDDILDYGDAGVSPIIFSNSVHNAAAFYVASVLKSRGPTLTITQLAFPFHNALLLARAWIEEKRCEQVLVGSVDECGAVMETICGQKLRIAEDGRIRPFTFSRFPTAVPGEGSVFFLLTGEARHGKYCSISSTSLYGGNGRVGKDCKDNEDGKDKDGGETVIDMCILDADGMSGDEEEYRNVVSPEALVAGYSPLFGSMPAGSGFNCAAAALMLCKQVRYANPVRDNPFGLNLCTATEHAPIRTIRCAKVGCGGRKASILLERSTHE